MNVTISSPEGIGATVPRQLAVLLVEVHMTDESREY